MRKHSPSRVNGPKHLALPDARQLKQKQQDPESTSRSWVKHNPICVYYHSL